MNLLVIENILHVASSLGLEGAAPRRSTAPIKANSDEHQAPRIKHNTVAQYYQH